MDVVMSPEERAEMEAAMNDGAATPGGVDADAKEAVGEKEAGEKAADSAAPTLEAATEKLNLDDAKPNLENSKLNLESSASPDHSAVSTPASGSTADLAKKADKAHKSKLTPEQKAKLQEMETEKDKKREERIKDLTAKLVARIRPYVDAKHPGDANDPETKAFEQRVKTEAEDLKLESFGVEMLHTIGQVYVTRAGNFVKSKKFFGGGFIGRLKEKGGMVKEGYGLLSSAIGVQTAMVEMEKMEQKGTHTPEEIAAAAEDLSGKMLLTTWRATRWEVINVGYILCVLIQILGPVIDGVLYEKGISKETALRRGKAIILIGTIFTHVQDDADDEERRELERLVQNAAGKKKKHEKARRKDKGKEHDEE